MNGKASPTSASTVISAYLWVSGVFALAASLIWAINTVFLMRSGGLTIFEVMLVNAVFTGAQLVFEVPTGVVADTIGRRTSMLLSMATLIVSTLLYAATPLMEWGIAGFFGASALLGLGYTFHTGAGEAWLVDALDHVGFEGPKEKVFARGQIAFGTGMLAGSLLGGVLGQLDLALPFLARASLLAVVFAIVFARVRDSGFERRPLSTATFGAETRKVLASGVRYGWRSPVVRPMLAISGFSGSFFMFAFYAWQPYVLDLLGRDYVWLLGVAQAGFSAAGIAGNAMVGRIMRTGAVRRDPAKVCAVASACEFAIAVAIAGVGFAFTEPGVAPAAIAIALWLAWGLVFGAYGPVRAAYINEHIPSSERATVLSFDALFADAGGAAGQPGLGWLAGRTSISVAWLVGSLGLALSAPLYMASSRAAAAAREG